MHHSFIPWFHWSIFTFSHIKMCSPLIDLLTFLFLAFSRFVHWWFWRVITAFFHYIFIDIWTPHGHMSVHVSVSHVKIWTCLKIWVYHWFFSRSRLNSIIDKVSASAVLVSCKKAEVWQVRNDFKMDLDKCVDTDNSQHKEGKKTKNVCLQSLNLKSC